jgi:GNAT superfamily N-acetyltransferase
MMKVSDVVKTRPMYVNRDFDRMIEIDCNTSGKYVWEPDELFKEMKKDWTCGVIAVDQEDYPLGFCIYNLDNPECFEIKHFVVDKIYHRLGVGTEIMHRMKAKLNSKRFYLKCDVPESNLPMHKFMSAVDFKSKLIRNTFEDIIRFTYEE